MQPKLLFRMKRIIKCPMCPFKTHHRTKYVDHTIVHREDINATFPCYFPNCPGTFTNYWTLSSHVKFDHRQDQHGETAAQDCVFKCQVCLCNAKGTEDFLQHLIGHLKDKIQVTCPMSDCRAKFTIVKSLNQHFKQKHPSLPYHLFDKSVRVEQSTQDLDGPLIPDLIMEVDEIQDSEEEDADSLTYSPYPPTTPLLTGGQTCLNLPNAVTKSAIRSLRKKGVKRRLETQVEEVGDYMDIDKPEFSSPLTSGESASPDKRRPMVSKWVDTLDIFIGSTTSRKLMAGKPSAHLRKIIVHAITNHIWEESENATRQEMGIVVSRFVNKYQTLQEKDPQGRLYGCGYAGLWKNVEDRYRYLKRQSKGTDGPVASSATTKNPSSRLKGAKNTDKYGCVGEMHLPNYPEGESEESLEKKRAALKQLVQNHGSATEISTLFNDTYSLLRRDIVKACNIAMILDRWPYVFTLDGAMAHSVIYTRRNFISTCHMQYAEKSSKYLDFFRSTHNTKKRAQDALTKMDEAIAAVGNNSPVHAGLMLIFSGYFGEDMDTVLIEEKNRSIEYLESDILPENPAVIYCGKDPMTSDKFMVSVGKTVVNTNISTFLAALSMCFSYYYMFNLRYSYETTAVMDLFQRSFFAITPPQGNNSRRRKDKASEIREVIEFNRVYSNWVTQRVKE